MKDRVGNEHSENNGQFVSKSGDTKKDVSKDTPAEIERANEITGKLPDTSMDELKEEERQDVQSLKGKNKTEEEFFGVEFKGVKGKDAIEKLLEEKKGHVKGAFNRKEIGDIDIAWGDKDGGLEHVILRRDKNFSLGKSKINGLDMVRKIPSIIKDGKFLIDEKDRPIVEYCGYRVAIKPTYDGKKLNWIITAMEIKKQEDN